MFHSGTNSLLSVGSIQKDAASPN